MLVDKYGFAHLADVVSSSGYAILDQAAIDAIKERWRWEPPPPECSESGVIVSVGSIWSLGEPGPDPIYLDHPAYPTEARARKQGGRGTVEYTVSGENTVTDAHVKSSTGSPALDAAMLAIIRDRKFVTSGTASKGIKETTRFEFIPQDNPESPEVVMGPAIIPNPAELPGMVPRLSFGEPYPPPSLANGCGRNAPASLDPSPTNINPGYPVEALSTRKQGRTVLDITVDRGGTASEVTVAETSGSPILDRAAVEGVKRLWHFQAPPPECADQDAHVRKNIDWSYGEAPNLRVMFGNSAYPAEAIAGKLSGRGRVQIKHSRDGEVEFTKVLVSTKSDILDAAMTKIITGAQFTPGTKDKHTELLSFAEIEFVGDPTAMQAEAAAPVQRIAPLPPPPSAANDCGRGREVYLAPVDSSHALVPIPMLAVEQTNRFHPRQAFRAQGALRMQILVDKDGRAASVNVAESSAPPEMERAITGTVKEKYRWAPPPPECAESGVMLNVNYVYTWAPEKLQIYADDPAYPPAARALSMGAAGVVEVQFHHDVLDDTKVLVGAKSPELDAAMISVVSERLLAELRIKPAPGFATTSDFAVMFMPTFVVSPKQQASNKPQAQAETSTPAQSKIPP